MSECVSLSRPTRVLSVIPVTGAPFFTWESNHPKAPPLIGPSLAVTDTPTESTDAQAAGPKNGYFRIHQISETEELKLASLSILDG